MNEDVIDRKLVCAFIAGLISDDGEREKGLDYIRNMPPVNPQPCEDAISRQAVRHILNHEVKMPIKVWKKVFELVDDLPPVIPQPKTGHWIWCIGSHKCSNCEEYTCFSHKELLRYCPNCGAKMVKPQERSDKE